MTINIRLYGDSLALPRNEVVKFNERYFIKLANTLSAESENICLLERAFNGATIAELSKIYWKDNGYYEGGGLFIIQSGIVDCAPRPIPEWIRNIIGIIPWIIQKRIISFIHNNRSKFLKNGISFRKTSLRKYSTLLKQLLLDAVSRFDDVYIINILPTTDTIENHSPGLKKSIIMYNNEIKKIVSEIRSCNLVDIHSKIEDLPDKHLYILEDGHHITRKTHDLIYREIFLNHKKKHRK